MPDLDTLTARELLPRLVNFILYGDIHEIPEAISGYEPNHTRGNMEAYTRGAIADTFFALTCDDPQIRAHAMRQVFSEGLGY